MYGGRVKGQLPILFYIIDKTSAASIKVHLTVYPQGLVSKFQNLNEMLGHRIFWIFEPRGSLLINFSNI